MKSVLILCTGNSCRSVMAEGLVNFWGNGRLRAYSAGSRPAGHVHPKSLETLRNHGLPASGYRSKSWDEFRDVPLDLVVTVCDNAAGEACPVFPGAPLKAHWGVPDPAHATGTPEEVQAVFDGVYRRLERRVRALAGLPVEAMPRAELQAALDAIGRDAL